MSLEDEEQAEVAAVEEKKAPAPKPQTPKKPGTWLRVRTVFARPISDRNRIRVLAGTAAAMFAAIMTATFLYPTYSARPTYDNTMVEVLILGLLPFSVVDFIDRRYKALIDTRIPDFLREIGDSQRTGTSFATSLVNASHANYGPLSKELRKAMAKMSWGFTFEDALNAFADGANTPLAHRVAVLLEEVGRSGGKMLQVLDSVYEHIREVINLQRERRKQLTPYLFVIYAAFGVYIFVVYILFTTFFAQVTSLQSSGAPFGANINPLTYYLWFYHLSLIEAVFGGLVVGKIASGSAISGLKHVLVLLLVSFVTFTVFIRP